MFPLQRLNPQRVLAVATMTGSKPSMHAVRSPKSIQALIQTRSKQSAASNDGRKAAISRAISANKTSAPEGSGEAVVDNIFGMRPVDYSVIPPIIGSPPPPPTKPGMRKFIFPATLVFSLFTVGYFYLNNKNDNFEYWSAMQRGEALQMDDDDDDDDDDDE